MSDKPRARRLADQIKTIVATAVDRRLKDPRLGFVTITDVRVTGDLQHASVFYTVFGSEEERTSTAAALKSATGMLRSEVGRQIGVRLTPSLQFIADAVPENARSIEDALVAARHRDAELERSRAGAQHAGEADPYRTARDETAEESLEESAAEPAVDSADDPAAESAGANGEPGRA